jgi:hypothetical protein
MKSFTLNFDSKWEQIPYGILSNTPHNWATSHEITVDTDFKTISKILSDSLIEIVKKSFETTSQSFKEEEEVILPEPISLETE